MLMRRTELPLTTKLSAENETPPIANVLLAAALLSSVVVSTFSHNATTMEPVSYTHLDVYKRQPIIGTSPHE